MSNENTGSYGYEEDENLIYGERMENLADRINELQAEGDGLPPLAEASTILQDYMDAWVLWNSYVEAGQTIGYYECLFQVVAKRAVFITKNIQ